MTDTTRDEILRIIDEEIASQRSLASFTERDEYRHAAMVLTRLLARIAPSPDRPCPFCGSDRVLQMASSETAKAWIECNECRARGPIAKSYGGDTRALWNKRAEG